MHTHYEDTTDQSVTSFINAKAALAALGERPQQLHSAAQEIVRCRTTLLRYILKLKRALDAQHQDLVETLTQRLIETSTDYISYGHFRLLNSCDAATHLRAAMENNTQQILAFVDQHGGSSVCLSDLRRSLEALAWHIEARFDIEDEIISA